MNLTAQHLPSPRFLRQRAATEARLGVRLWKYFMGDEPPPDAPCREEIERLLAENARIRAAVAEARLALARAFGDTTEGE